MVTSFSKLSAQATSCLLVPSWWIFSITKLSSSSDECNMSAPRLQLYLPAVVTNVLSSLPRGPTQTLLKTPFPLKSSFVEPVQFRFLNRIALTSIFVSTPNSCKIKSSRVILLSWKTWFFLPTPVIYAARYTLKYVIGNAFPVLLAPGEIHNIFAYISKYDNIKNIFQ